MRTDVENHGFAIMSAAFAPTVSLRRLSAIAACVVALHALALWEMQRGLRQQEFPPVTTLLALNVKLIVPPAPPAFSLPVAQPVPEPAPALAPKPPAPQPIRKKPKPPEVVQPQLTPQPAPEAAPEPAPPRVAELADTGTAPSPAPSAPAQPATGQPTAAGPAAPVELSSSDVQPLDNPPPPYPAMSRRLGETGNVIVRVLIDTEGRAREVRLQRSSGHDRLDGAALQAVRHWRWRPVVRHGAPQAAWFNQPVAFVLQ